MKTWILSAALSSAAALAWLGLVAGPERAEVPAREHLPPTSKAARWPALGASSCAAGACHGGTAEVAGQTRSSAAHTIWGVRDESHRRAFETLRQARSATIMKNLGWTQPAVRERRCLACHATPTSSAAEASVETIRREGVGCEACHGPAGGWISEHATRPWQLLAASEKLARGMLPTADLADRVRGCSGCHVGAPSEPSSPFPDPREVTHDMIAAGHPRLNFEFASYHDLLPRHWDAKEADDPGRAAASRRWVAGRIGTGLAALELLRDRASRAAERGPWPELSEHDCFACHHDLRGEAESRWRKDGGRAAARPSWGSWYFADVEALLPRPATHAGEKLEQPIRSLRETMNASSPNADDAVRGAEAALGALRRLQGDATRWNPAEVERLARALDPSFRPRPPAGWDEAAQAYLGLIQISRNANAADRDRLRRMGRDLGFPENSDSPAGFHPSRLAAPSRSDPAPTRPEGGSEK